MMSNMGADWARLRLEMDPLVAVGRWALSGGRESRQELQHRSGERRAWGQRSGWSLASVW